MNPRKLRNWKALLIYLHRWMGMGFGVVFAVWFISGVAMMYVGMPHLSAGERLGHLSELDLSTASVSPADVARRHGLGPEEFRAEMFHNGRPVYRFAGGAVVYADTGGHVTGASAEQATALVRRWVPAFADSVRYDARLATPDQWTLSSPQQAALPLHRIEVGDPPWSVLARTGGVGSRGRSAHDARGSGGRDRARQAA